MNRERILKQIRDIKEGLYRKVLPDKRYAVLYSLRTYECTFCKHKTKKLGFDSCGICGCFIPLKVRSVTDTNDCPIGKWIDKSYFGKFEYKSTKLYRGHDSTAATKELSPILLMLKQRLKMFCTKSQFKRAYKMSLMINKRSFEEELCKFMNDSSELPKSKFRRKHQYELEKTIRELNTAIKAMYILQVFNDSTLENVRKK